MKFGTIAAILIAFGAPLLVLVHIFSPSGIFEMSADIMIIPGIYFAFIGPPSAFLTSIMGIKFDKHKGLAEITMVFSIIWIAFVCWLIYSLSTMRWFP